MLKRDFYFKVVCFDTFNCPHEYEIRIGVNSLNFITDIKNAWVECFAQIDRECFEKDFILRKLELMLVHYEDR